MVDINRVRVLWTGVAGSPYYTSLYTLASAVTAQEAIDGAEALVDANRFHVYNQITATIEPDVPTIDTATGNITAVRVGTGATVLQSGGGSADSPALQGLYRLQTGVYVGGRQVRGRIYWPGVIPGDIAAGGSVSAAYIDDFEENYAAYQGLVNDADVVWSRKEGGAHGVTSATVWNKWAILRSRRD